MIKKTSAHYQREYRRRLREQGLVKKEVWIRQDNAKLLHEIELRLRSEPASELSGTSNGISKAATMTWNIEKLFEALIESQEFAEKVSIELIDSQSPSIHMVMREYGDLPVYLAVCGEQIIVESLLWPLADVKNSALFNEVILKTHKFIPLSTIGLETFDDGTSYYYMFGALSASSLLGNIIFEINCLASNVIQTTQAFADFINLPE